MWFKMKLYFIVHKTKISAYLLFFALNTSHVSVTYFREPGYKEIKVNSYAKV